MTQFLFGFLSALAFVVVLQWWSERRFLKRAKLSLGLELYPNPCYGLDGDYRVYIRPKDFAEAERRLDEHFNRRSFLP